MYWVNTVILWMSCSMMQFWRSSNSFDSKVYTEKPNCRIDYHFCYIYGNIFIIQNIIYPSTSLHRPQYLWRYFTTNICLWDCIYMYIHTFISFFFSFLCFCIFIYIKHSLPSRVHHVLCCIVGVLFKPTYMRMDFQRCEHTHI